ncbi:MAG: [protein-PII] uridylyltransferase [Halieaceae bacterium]|jgi:[protein-PII] uridylyltransferase
MVAIDVALPKDLFDVDALAAEIVAGNLIACCKQALAKCTDYLHQRFREGAEARDLIKHRAAYIDQLLSLLWQRQSWGDSALALVAVGGYGRGELHPHSDIDLLILLGPDCKGVEEEVSEFLTLLWDIGLNVGHSVRNLKECEDRAREDITVVTNLMESRVIQGSAGLMAEVRAAISTDKMWASADFFKAKLTEQQHRHTKFADTEYNLEPNVKSSPGGLRDIQIIRWIAERHFGVKNLQELQDEEFLNADELEILSRGRDFMWQVRYALHMITGREEDRLLFDHQRELAAMWGFTDGDRLAVEQFMQTYYRWALSLGQLNEVLVQYFDQAILRADSVDEIGELNERFEIRNGYIEARNESLFASEPSSLLEVFLLCATHENIIGIGAKTIRLIRDHRHLIDEAFRARPKNHALFLDILRAPYKMTLTLRRMNRYGVLGMYIPEFGRIVGQMQHDLFHTYTVDAHTLQVIQNMRRFNITAYEENFPVSSRVARRLPKIELLYLAGLFHDVGKGRGGDHSELGAVDSRIFCQTHGLSQQDTSLVVWLVESHLTMSAVSQRKDISDPDVILQFAQHVGDQERLDYLFTLTVADINGTNPTLWNAWRGSLLRQLYTETKRALRRGLENPVDKQVWIDETRNAAIDILEYRGFTVAELDALWQERGEDYFLRERAEDIAWHTEAVAGHYEPDKPLVLIRNTIDSSVANTTQIFIHARSRAQLFSSICALLEQLDLSVHDARIYNDNHGMSLDTFFVLDPSGQSIAEDGQRLRDIAEQLTIGLSAAEDYPNIVERRTPRQMKSFTIPTETRMSIDEIKNVSVLEVATPDRPGLLARIGRIFVEFNVTLQAAKIQTLGERVEDVFFITDENQQAITDGDLCAAIQAAVREELDQQLAA